MKPVSIQLLVVATIFTLLCLTGCSKRVPVEELGAEEAFRYLSNLYDKGDYLDAANGLDYYTLNHSGSALVDSAQYLLGLSHFELKEYLLAANAFEELYIRFQRSKLIPEAMFMVGLCYWKLTPKYSLDQEYNYKAQDAMQTFIDYNPSYKERVQEAQEIIDAGRERLAHKEYANGIIYMKMNDYDAAVIYFKGVVDLFYDTEWAPKASFQIGASNKENKLFDEAKEAYREFMSKYPDHPWHDKAEAELNKLNEIIAG